MSSPQTYERVSCNSCSSEKLGSFEDTATEDEDEAFFGRPRPQSTKYSRKYWLLLLATLSHSLVAVVTYSFTRSNIACSKHREEQLSPWMSDIDRSFHYQTGNAAEAKSNDPSNPDAANPSWNNFTVATDDGGSSIEDWYLDLGAYTKPVLVPEQYAKDFNFDPTRHALVSPSDPEYAPGAVPYKGYPASIEVMHKLHCLNLLRQALYYNHEYYRSVHGEPWALPEHDLVRHIAHCVDIFRQHIICEAEVELVPFLNDETYHRRNDWARPKKCRNFESVRSWLYEHQWKAGDPHFYLDDDHPNVTEVVTKKPKHSMEELWRGS